MIRSRLSQLRQKAKRQIWRIANPVSQKEIRSVLLEALGVGVDTLMVHASLSALGHITCGPRGIISSLQEFCNSLVLPTHSYTYPEAAGMPATVFDAEKTPSQNGVLTEVFRQQPDVCRSIHSTHSLAVSGQKGHALINGHYLSVTPCGKGTPYSRMIDISASALLWGVSFHSYTFYHTAEDAADSPFAYEEETIDWLRVLDEERRIVDCQSKRQTRNPRRFADCGELLEAKGLVERTRLGAGHLLFVQDCAKVHDFLVERLRKVPDFLFENCRIPLD